MPVSATVCAAEPPPVDTIKLAVAAPVAVGLNTKLTLQLAPTASEVPQVVVCENSVAFAPESAMLVIGSAKIPVFVTVTVCAALDVFVCTLPKAIAVGDTVYVATAPVPDKDTDCEAAPLPVVTVKLADAPPVAVGVNTTLIAQLAPTATEDPQVDVSENDPTLAPERAMLVIGSANVPVLVTVTVCATLDAFVCTLPNAIAVGDTV